MMPVQILLNYFQYLDFKNNVLPLQHPPSTILIKAISQMTTWLLTISLFTHTHTHTQTHTHRILRECGMGLESEVWCLISDSAMHLLLDLGERSVTSMNIYLSIYKLRVDIQKKFAFIQLDIEEYSE